jgi:galactofuranose transport system substrate-binding protein
MKASRLIFNILIAAALICSSGCQPLAQAASKQVDLAPNGKPRKTYQDLIVGYAQLGAESEWRSANTLSVKETAEELGIELRFYDAQQKQANQIQAVRKLIVQKVDVIGIAPNTETGWQEVFQEAYDAGIPIILVDREADVPENQYVTWLGSDFVEEGKKAARIMLELTGDKANIIELEGTVGSSAAKGRSIGFREVLKDYPGMKIIDSQDGNFTVAKGKEVMRDFLQKYGKEIDAVFSQNDDMSIGAIEAIEEYGLKPGVDIKIVSVDAARVAFKAMIDGKLNATVECNPLLGPQFFELALKVVNGEEVPKWVPSKESVFFPEDAAELISTRKY